MGIAWGIAWASHGYRSVGPPFAPYCVFCGLILIFTDLVTTPQKLQMKIFKLIAKEKISVKILLEGQVVAVLNSVYYL